MIKKTHLKSALFLGALLILCLIIARPQSGKAQAMGLGPQQPPVVRAVMFWMDGCPHCHIVIDEVLPALQEKYGDQFQVQLVELVTSEDVDQLYQTATTLNIPKDAVGVPFLVIGDRVLIGSDQIPAELPGLIEKHIAAGGLDYPAIPALLGAIPPGKIQPENCAPGTPCDKEIDPGSAATTPMAVAAAVESGPLEAPISIAPRSDGIYLAIATMIGMAMSLGYTGVRFVQGYPNNKRNPYPGWMDFATPVLAILGSGVAGYLAYVETQAVSAICGPVGDCNAVQSSSYARLFDVLPIGVLGAAGYVLILATWTWKRLRSDWLGGFASRIIFGMALLGTLFSLYLTYLEPFVIKAVCIWCLTSSVLITLILLANLPQALAELKESWDLTSQ